MKPLISIVMAVYNGEKYLEEQLGSILGQTYKNIELVIIEDVSTDGSLRICENVARGDGRVKIHKNSENLGAVRSFLKGLQFARGELVCFSDQDDLWRADKLDILARLIQNDPRNMLSYSDLEICDENLLVTHPSFWRTAGIAPRQGQLGEMAFLRNIMPGCSMIFRKEVANELARFTQPRVFMHDHLAFVVASSLGRIVYSSQTLVKYRQHGSNQIGAFYDSVVNPERVIEELTEKVKESQIALHHLRSLNLEKLLSFCECLQKGGFVRRMSFLRYYLFLRNDRFLDKMLGFLECLCPPAYQGLKKMGFKKNILNFITRIIFLGWAVTVLGAFILQFFLVKLNALRSWGK